MQTYKFKTLLTFTIVPLGMCLSTTQLLVLLVACPPGPDPLTNCSSRSFSFKTGRSISPFLLAASTKTSPGRRGLSSGKLLGEPLHKLPVNKLYIELMDGGSRDILKTHKAKRFLVLWRTKYCCACQQTGKHLRIRPTALYFSPRFTITVVCSCLCQTS